jgi:hypothetical protein
MIITKRLNSIIIKLIILTVSLSFIKVYSQDLDSLNQKKYIDDISEIDTLLKDYKIKNNLKILSLIPTVSYGIDPLTGRNSFNVAISLNPLINYLQDKNKNKIELKNLDMKLREKYYNEFLINQNKIEILKIDSLKIEHAKKNLVFHEQRKIIREKQYKNNEINLEDYINFQEQYQIKTNELEQLETIYNIKITNLKNLLK